MKSVLILILASFLLYSCASPKPKSLSEIYKGHSAEQIYQRGEQAMASHGYKKAIEDFEAIQALYPFSQYADQAQLNLIYANFADNEFAQTEAAASRYIHLYPRAKHVDYAYYMKGLANFNQDRGIFQRYIRTDLSKRDVTTVQQSFADFNELVRRFPNSDYAYDARERMIYLRNLMARQQLNTAVYYFSAKAYLAAINRANEVIIHFRETPQVISALGVIAQSYHYLGLTDMAEQTKAILAMNFPESEVYRRVVEVLKQPVSMTSPPIYN